MSGELVLITGVSGLVGHSVLFEALSSGYNARAVVRKEADIEKVKNAFSSTPELLPRIEFSIVPDLAAPNAFADSMTGVAHVIHIASAIPHPTDDYVRDYFRPAIDMTINILTAAQNTPNVKRVVLTSSIGAYIPIMDFAAGKLNGVFTADQDNCHYDIKTPFNHDLLAYAASKAMQLDAAQDFITKEKPKFELVAIMPTFVLGEDRLATKSEDYFSTTNKLVLKLILGNHVDPYLGSTVSLHDVAKLHVLALDQSVPAGRYMAASDGLKGVNWNDAFAIVKRHFPEASEKVFASGVDEKFVINIDIDASKTEKAFGFKFQTYEDQVKSIVSSYLSLLKKEGKY